MLLGFCFGGVLAYEVAQQLVRSGEEVSVLVMLDSILKGAVERNWQRSMRNRAKRLRNRIVDSLPDSVRLRVMHSEQNLTETDRLNLVRVRIYREALRRYRVRAYGAPVVLLQPEATLRENVIADPTYGWGRHVSQLDLIGVPGDHHGHLKRPNVRAVATALSPHIARARPKRNFTNL